MTSYVYPVIISTSINNQGVNVHTNKNSTPNNNFREKRLILKINVENGRTFYFKAI